MLQKLWKMNISWDELLEEETSEVAHRYLKDMSEVPKLTVPRAVKLKWGRGYLHVFYDVSLTTYRVVAFM